MLTAITFTGCLRTKPPALSALRPSGHAFSAATSSGALPFSIDSSQSLAVESSMSDGGPGAGRSYGVGRAAASATTLGIVGSESESESESVGWDSKQASARHGGSELEKQAPRSWLDPGQDLATGGCEKRSLFSL